VIENKIVDEAINEGFKFDGKENKIPVEKFNRQTAKDVTAISLNIRSTLERK
jgi:hypothetical protein